LNPYANYGASTSSGNGGPTGEKWQETAAPVNPGEPRPPATNARCNDGGNVNDLRSRVAAAVLAGDDVEAARLMALLGRPALRVVR